MPFFSAFAFYSCFPDHEKEQNVLMGNPDGIKSAHKRDESGFTLVELLIVTALIGTLAAIAVPQYSSQRKSACNVAAKADARHIYTASYGYFTENSGGTIADVSDLASYGFSQSEAVSIVINNGTQAGLSIAVTADNGTKKYTVNADGTIDEAEKG